MVRRHQGADVLREALALCAVRGQHAAHDAHGREQVHQRSSALQLQLVSVGAVAAQLKLTACSVGQGGCEGSNS